MPAFTVNRGYPYSLPTDPADVPAALQSLAEAIDDDVCSLTNSIAGRPASRFRGTGTFDSFTTSLGFTVGTVRVPFDTTDFNTVPATMQSQEVGNRLIKPDVPGFYFVLGTVYVPVMTVAGTTVNFMAIQIRKCDASSPLTNGTRLVGSSHNVPVSADDRNVRVFSVGTGVFMNGTTDAFSLEFRADTTPDVASYTINERTLTFMRMTQS